MAYTNIWDDTKPTGSEAANTIDDLMRSGKVDIEQRFNDMFAMPSFATDPLRLYGLKFTDAQDSVINLGDNAGTPRNLIIKNKAGATTYFTFGSNGLTITPIASALGLQISTLGGTTSGLQFHQTGVQDWSIGCVASPAGNFVINNGSTFAGTNYLTLTPGGAFQLIGSLQLTSNVAAPFGGFGKSASQGLVIAGVTGSTNDFLLANGVGSNVLFIPTGTLNVSLAGGLTVANGITVSASGINVNGGILINNGGLTVSVGTTTVQGLSAGSASITGTLSSGGQIQGNVSGGDINSAFLASSATPAYAWKATGGAANEKVWDAVVSGSSLFFRTALDAGGGNVNWLQVTRSGTTISNVIVPNGGFVVNTDPGGTETIRTTGALRIANAVGNFIINKHTTAPVDSKTWWYQILGTDGTLRIRAVNDAETNGFNALTCTRTGITPLILTLMPDGGTVVSTGALTASTGLTVTTGGLTVSAGTTAVQALTASTLNTSGLATVNSLMSVGAITTNQNDLTFIGGAVDTLFRNSANNASNVSISDAGDLVALRGIINTATGYRVGNSAGSGLFLRGNGTNYVGTAISTADLPTLDSVRAYKSAASQALSQNTLTAISFDAEDYDTNTMHDNVTNNSRLTAQSSGKYKITAHIGWTGVSSNVFIIIRKNGVATNLAETFLAVTSTSVGTTEVNCTLSLAANDYVEVYGQGDNVTPTILNNQERTYFEMQKLTA